MDTPERISGHVKWFNAPKGFGFLAANGHDDVFVHHSQIKMPGYRSLEEGQAVTFVLVRGPKGLAAENVEIVEDASPRQPHARTARAAGIGI